MGKLTGLAAGLLVLAAGDAYAAATAYAHIDWAGVTYESTGVEFSLSALHRPLKHTILVTGTGVNAGPLGVIGYNQNGQSAQLFNGPMQRAAIESTNEDFDLNAFMHSYWDVTLTGSGSVTFQVPFEYHIAQTGGHLVNATLNTRIEGAADGWRYKSATRSSSDMFNEGLADMKGAFVYTLSNAGPEQHYRLYSALSAQIIPGVPEPESYAMMGLGMGAIWFARRRRKAT